MIRPMRSFVLLCTLILCSAHTVRADHCDDQSADAHATVKDAERAARDQEYEAAANLFDEAADQYDEIGQLRKCRCPKIVPAAPGNAQKARSSAARYAKLGAEQDSKEAYAEGRETYQAGNASASKGDWDSAVSSFEEAATTFEDIIADDDANPALVDKAKEGARMSHEAADRARSKLESQ